MESREAKEQLLQQIELELCRIHDANSDAPKKLWEFYEYVENLPTTDLIFQWCLLNSGNIRIGFIDGAVQVCKIKDSNSERMYGDDEFDDLLWEVI